MPSFCRNYGACNTKQVSHSYGFTDSHMKQELQQSRKRCRECHRKWPSPDGWVGSLKAPQRVTCSTRGCYSALWFVKSCVLCPFSFVPVFLALHFTVWHNQHHRNKTALQRALESSIYARIWGSSTFYRMFWPEELMSQKFLKNCNEGGQMFPRGCFSLKSLLLVSGKWWKSKSLAISPTPPPGAAGGADL